MVPSTRRRPERSAVAPSWLVGALMAVNQTSGHWKSSGLFDALLVSKCPSDGARLAAVEFLLEDSPQVLQRVQVWGVARTHLHLPESWQIRFAPLLRLFRRVCRRPVLHEDGRQHVRYHFSLQNGARARGTAERWK